MDTQFDSWSDEDKAYVAHVDLDHVSKGHQKRLKHNVAKLDEMWDGHLGVLNVTSHCTNVKPEVRPVS